MSGLSERMLGTSQRTAGDCVGKVGVRVTVVRLRTRVREWRLENVSWTEERGRRG